MKNIPQNMISILCINNKKEIIHGFNSQLQIDTEKTTKKKNGQKV